MAFFLPFFAAVLALAALSSGESSSRSPHLSPVSAFGSGPDPNVAAPRATKSASSSIETEPESSSSSHLTSVAMSLSVKSDGGILSSLRMSPLSSAASRLPSPDLSKLAKSSAGGVP